MPTQPRIFITATYQGDQNRAEIERLCAIANAAGFEDFCFVRDVENYQPLFTDPAELMQRALEEIEASDYLLIDLSTGATDWPDGAPGGPPSGAPTGRAYEAGMAYALGVKVVVIAQKGTRLKDTTRGIAAALIEYDALDDILAPLSHLAAAHTASPEGPE